MEGDRIRCDPTWMCVTSSRLTHLGATPMVREPAESFTVTESDPVCQLASLNRELYRTGPTGRSNIDAHLTRVVPDRGSLGSIGDCNT